MKKIAAAFLFALVVGVSGTAAFAQSMYPSPSMYPTSTVKPSPSGSSIQPGQGAGPGTSTTMPSGAPNTGLGGTSN